MINPRLSAAFAVLLPVCLGLGLVYLVTVGRIDAGAALGGAVGLAALMGAVVVLRDIAADQDVREDKRRRY